MAESKTPPYVSVEYIRKSSDSQSESNMIQPGTQEPPPPVDQEPAALVESNEPDEPPYQDDSTEALAGLQQIADSDVIIRGLAALTMATMLDMEHVWDIETGDPITLDEAKKQPHRAWIDFEELQQSAENVDPTNVAELIAALPTQKSRKSKMIEENAKIAFTKGAAGPGVVVKQIPGLVRIEVGGPVTLQKLRQGNVRILQVKYKTVEAPTGAAGVKPQDVQVQGRHIENPHKVTTRMPAPKRTVPRIPPPVSETHPKEPTSSPEPEELIEDDYTF